MEVQSPVFVQKMREKTVVFLASTQSLIWFSIWQTFVFLKNWTAKRWWLMVIATGGMVAGIASTVLQYPMQLQAETVVDQRFESPLAPVALRLDRTNQVWPVDQHVSVSERYHHGPRRADWDVRSAPLNQGGVSVIWFDHLHQLEMGDILHLQAKHQGWYDYRILEQKTVSAQELSQVTIAPQERILFVRQQSFQTFQLFLAVPLSE